MSLDLLMTAVEFDVLRLVTDRVSSARTAVQVSAAGAVLDTVPWAPQWLSWLLASR